MCFVFFVVETGFLGMKRLEGIRAVTFDVGSTLIEAWPSVGAVYAQVAAQHGCPALSAAELERRFREAFEATDRRANSRADWERIVDAAFAGLVATPPSRTFFPALYEWFAQAQAWRIFDDVLPTLAALRARGLRLGVISNWDDRLRGLLQALDLARHFDVIVVSCEVGVLKPERPIFEAALSALDLPAATVVHVGDDFESDVVGARAAGLHGLHLVRHGTAGDHAITSLGELLDRIELARD
ncbi:MAG: HAD-IA family hydrolase [Verrucomicrobiales bacterium]|nr:HAD-IA family hydrolase [Verrucomicrobiales bacterium]